jgi:hypothetical protein
MACAREEERIAQARKENATTKALDILNEPAAPLGGVFSPNHLQQLGFEALVAEIRRTVKEELQAELQTGTVEIPKAAASKKKPVSVPVEEDLDEVDDEILEETYESSDEEDAEEDDLGMFMKLFADDDDDIDDELFDLDLDDEDESDDEEDDESEDTLWDDSEDEDMDDVDSDNNDEDDELFKDDFALEDFQFAFDEDDVEEVPSYEESDEFDELDLDSLDDIAGSDFAIPRSQYQVPVVFELTLEELMEMTDEY